MESAKSQERYTTSRLIERRFKDNDLQGVLKLLRSSFDGWHDIQYWVWKFEENPHGSPEIWVAEDNGKIVGCYILNPVRLTIGQVSVMSAQSVDAAVDEAYRGAGIFKRLAANAIARAAKEGVALIYAFPTEIAYKGQVRIGYRPAFVIPVMVKVLHMSSLLEKQSFNSLFLKKFLGIMRPPQRTGRAKINSRPNDGLVVREISGFDSRFETFWTEIKQKNRDILIERDQAYLEWRYTEHPEKQYTTYVCERHDKIVGYAVLSVEKNVSMERGRAGRISVGNIIDLVTLPNMTDAAHVLISASCDYFEREAVDIARCWMFGWHPFHKTLRKFGFSEQYELLRRAVFRPRYNAQLICYVNSKATIQEAIRSMRNQSKPCWFIMQGDADYM